MFQKSLTFDDFLLIPQYSDIESRSEVDISSQLDTKLKLDTPIISSPMDTVTEHVMASTMSRKGGLGIIHRYNSIEEQLKQVDEANCGFDTIGAAVGVKDDFLERTQELVKKGAKVICVDVAHGDHISVKKAIEALEKLPERSKFHLMAGNIATGEGYKRLAQWGADSVRVGIGGGCFVPETLVNTESGFKKIEDIKVGDRVFSHTGKLQPVIDTLAFDRDEEIISINGIDCTKNHEFYILDKENVNRVNEDNIHLFARWVHAEELDIEKHLLIELE